MNQVIELNSKLISLTADQWKQIEQINIPVPKTNYSFSKANPFTIFKEVIKDKNRKWLVLMFKAILEYYSLKITIDDQGNFCLGILDSAAKDSYQSEKTIKFLENLNDLNEK